MVRLAAGARLGDMDRRAAVAELLRERGDRLLVVSGLGSPSYDVHAVGDHDANYYLWGAMGGAALVGLGLALAQPSRRVLVVTGDGEQLMGLGGLATIAIAAPPNLIIAVVDNGHYGETGMQVSHTGAGLDLAAVATACGFSNTAVARTEDDVADIRKRYLDSLTGPSLVVLKVRPENLPRSLPARDAVYIKNRLRGHLGYSLS